MKSFALFPNAWTLVGALLVALVTSTSTAGAAESAIISTSSIGEPPIGLTAELDHVPTLAPLALATPYQLDWQKRVLSFQNAFESKLPGGTALQVDPIETGSINAAR